MLSGGVKFIMPVINIKFISNIITLTYFIYLGFLLCFLIKFYNILENSQKSIIFKTQFRMKRKG